MKLEKCFLRKNNIVAFTCCNIEFWNKKINGKLHTWPTLSKSFKREGMYKFCLWIKSFKRDRIDIFYL